MQSNQLQPCFIANDIVNQLEDLSLGFDRIQLNIDRQRDKIKISVHQEDAHRSDPTSPARNAPGPTSSSTTKNANVNAGSTPRPSHIKSTSHLAPPQPDQHSINRPVSPSFRFRSTKKRAPHQNAHTSSDGTSLVGGIQPGKTDSRTDVLRTPSPGDPKNPVNVKQNDGYKPYDTDIAFESQNRAGSESIPSDTEDVTRTMQDLNTGLQEKVDRINSSQESLFNAIDTFNAKIRLPAGNDPSSVPQKSPHQSFITAQTTLTHLQSAHTALRTSHTHLTRLLAEEKTKNRTLELEQRKSRKEKENEGMRKALLEQGSRYGSRQVEAVWERVRAGDGDGDGEDGLGREGVGAGRRRGKEKEKKGGLRGHRRLAGK